MNADQHTGAAAPAEQPIELLPNTFRCLDREWTVRFTDGLLQRINDSLQVDLWNAIELKNNPLAALGENERKLRAAVLIVIEQQVADAGVDQQEFVDAFCGEVFDEAFLAVQGGLERFFSARRRAALRQAIGYMDQRGMAEMEAKTNAMQAGIEEAKTAGIEAIKEMRPTVRTAILTEVRKRFKDGVQQALKSELTSSNAAETADSPPKT